MKQRWRINASHAPQLGSRDYYIYAIAFASYCTLVFETDIVTSCFSFYSCITFHKTEYHDPCGSMCI